MVQGKQDNLKAGIPAYFNFSILMPRPLLTIMIHREKFLIWEDQLSGIPESKSSLSSSSSFASSISPITIYLKIRPVINIPSKGGRWIKVNSFPTI